MDNNQIENFIQSTIKQFEYYKKLGEKTFTQLNPEQLFWSGNDNCNSIAVIVQHLHGNMMSRWTDFLNTDGEKEFRNRDQEFEIIINHKDEMLLKWEQGWACLFEALSSINVQNFNQLVYIRNQGHTIIEAVNRQLAHYAYHIGQIVLIGKLLAKDWESLSIPKGNSKHYNKEKFEKPKARGHFTDSLLKNKDPQ